MHHPLIFVMVEADSEDRKSMTPTVVYEYQFNGMPLRGSRIRYGQVGRLDRPHAEETLKA